MLLTGVAFQMDNCQVCLFSSMRKESSPPQKYLEANITGCISIAHCASYRVEVCLQVREPCISYIYSVNICMEVVIFVENTSLTYSLALCTSLKMPGN